MEKWNTHKQRPIPNSTCNGVSAKYLCKVIADKIALIESVFDEFAYNNQIPTVDDLKAAINEGKNPCVHTKKTLSELCMEYLRIQKI